MTDPLDREGSTLAIHSDQSGWTPAQKQAILQASNLAENTPDAQLEVFFHVAQRLQLDPFRKQVYLIGRNTKDGDRHVMKYTIQTGIDGFRATGARLARKAGVKLVKPTIEWCGEDGEWRDVWIGAKDENGHRQPPVAARATGWVGDDKVVTTALYDEFVQTVAKWEGPQGSRKKVGEGPNSMWEKMPSNQLAKCCEALWYRRAFPDDLSGVYTDDELDPNGPNVITGQGTVVSTTVEGEAGGDNVSFTERLAAMTTVKEAQDWYRQLSSTGKLRKDRADALIARASELGATPKTEAGAADGDGRGADADEGAAPASPTEEPQPRYCVHGVRAQHGTQGWWTTCRDCDSDNDDGKVTWAEGDNPDA